MLSSSLRTVRANQQSTLPDSSPLSIFGSTNNKQKVLRTMSSVAGMLGLPPGVHFRPDDDELVEFYLLPRARGEPAPFPAGVVVVDDDAAGSTLPWELLERHGRGAEDEAYFLVRGSGDGGDGQDKRGDRQERGCGGGGTWKSQKRLAHGGEKVRWSRHNLNLHMGRGESGGSVGWVMHEYALTDPSCPPLKICHVAFTGHGKNRKRLPGGGDVDDQTTEEPASKRARVAAAAGTGGSASSSGSGSTTTTVDQDYPSVERCSEEHQEPKQHSLEWISRVLSNDDLLQSSFPSSVDQNYFFREFAQAAAPTTEQQVPEHVMLMAPLPIVQETAGIAELQECMTTPMDQPEFVPPLPTVQETAGMAELENPYQPMMTQPEFLAPMGVTIADMEAGAQQDVVEWDGFLFY